MSKHYYTGGAIFWMDQMNLFMLESNELIWPFLQIIVAADDADFESWAVRQFSTDRRRRVKGVVEVIL